MSNYALYSESWLEIPGNGEISRNRYFSRQYWSLAHFTISRNTKFVNFDIFYIKCCRCSGSIYSAIYMITDLGSGGSDNVDTVSIQINWIVG